MKQLVGSRFQVSGGVDEFTVATAVFPVILALSPSAPLGAPEMLLPTAALQRSCAEKHCGLLPEGCLTQSSDKEGRTGEGSEKENLH